MVATQVGVHQWSRPGFLSGDLVRVLFRFAPHRSWLVGRCAAAPTGDLDRDSSTGSAAVARGPAQVSASCTAAAGVDGSDVHR